jgi:hypothetical protein
MTPVFLTPTLPQLVLVRQLKLSLVQLLTCSFSYRSLLIQKLWKAAEHKPYRLARLESGVTKRDLPDKTITRKMTSRRLQSEEWYVDIHIILLQDLSFH